MSAFDPKPPSKGFYPFRASQPIATIACLSLGGDDEATRFHYACWRGGGLIAASGVRAAADDAGDWFPEQRTAAGFRADD